MKLFTNSDEPGTSLGVIERFCYGCGNFGNGLIAQILAAFLLFFYTDYINLDPAIVGILFMVVRVTDGVTDLIMGNIVDHTKSKHGKARIWLVRMCAPYAIAGVLLFTVPMGIPQAAQYAYVFVVYLLVSAVLTTALAVPYASMAALITSNPYERGILGIFSMFGGTFAGLAISAFALKLVALFGDGQRGWICAAAVIGVVGIVFQLICFKGTKERTTDTGQKSKDKKEENKVSVKDSVIALFKNKYWVMFIVMSFGLWLIVGLQSASMIYYCNSVIGSTDAYSVLAMVGNVAMLGFLLISFIFMKKLGKENTFRIGCFASIAGSLFMIFFATNLPLLVVGTAIRSAGNGLASACMTGILADSLDFGEWKTGISAVGLGMAAYSACQKLGSGLSSALWGVLLKMGNYDGALSVQPSSAIRMIKMGYYYIPLIVCIICVPMILQFNLDKQQEKIHADLDVRRGVHKEEPDTHEDSENQ